MPILSTAKKKKLLFLCAPQHSLLKSNVVSLGTFGFNIPGMFVLMVKSMCGSVLGIYNCDLHKRATAATLAVKQQPASLSLKFRAGAWLVLLFKQQILQ